ncbi:TRAP transporter small permease [Parabacteroides sp. OttesenSCG-928-N08]|nr:TRAP transporter small permease [Parabacteroides sp. OttesenSCG-928-N08]
MRKVIDKMLGHLLVFLMTFLVVDVLWQVMSRYLMSSPSSFTDELAGMLLIWVGLLGAAYVFGRNEHLAIDLLLQKLSPKRQLVLQTVIWMIVLLFALTVFVIGGSWLVYTRFYLEVTSASLQLNMGYVYLVLPVSGLLTVYYAIDNSRRLWKGEKLINE